MSNSLVKRSTSYRSIFPFHEPMDKPFITKSINSHSFLSVSIINCIIMEDFVLWGWDAEHY